MVVDEVETAPPKGRASWLRDATPDFRKVLDVSVFLHQLDPGILVCEF